MHEMSICEGIVQVLEEQAASQGYRQVKAVWLEIGRLSGVEIEALRFGFDVVTRNTLAADATLEIIDVPGEAWCLTCAKTVSIDQKYAACPTCNGYHLQITGGEELRIKELEVN